MPKPLGSHQRHITYILVLHESLWMGDTLDHTLVNPNQLRHYGNRVEDNLMQEICVSVITEDEELAWSS